MSEFDAQRVAERIDIVLEASCSVAGDYHSAIHNSRYLKQNSCAKAAESTL